MTYARWRGDGFDADFVAAELARTISAGPSGGLEMSGEAFFGDPLVLLETGIEFRDPVSGETLAIADADRSRIIDGALEAALRSGPLNSSALIGEINKATHKFVGTPEKGYVVATEFSFKYFEDITRIEHSGYRLYVRRRLPRYLAGAHQEARRRSQRSVRGDYPEDVPFQRYTPAWIHVRGRSEYEAVDRAVEALDLRRGIWNYLLNTGTGRAFPPPRRGPINEVLAGPIYSLHRKDGALAVEYDWYDPEYIEPRLSRNLQRKWERVFEEEKNIRVLLNRSPYRAILEGALRRYCQALDSVDLSRAYLELWGLLETLTGISEQDSHKSVVNKAAFIWAASEYETHQQVLHHLRRHRNSYAHSGEPSQQRGAYLHQLRFYVEQLLRFHLINSRQLGSMERAARFLDLPHASSDLQHSIDGREKVAEEASEAAQLAREGLRFRQSG